MPRQRTIEKLNIASLDWIDDGEPEGKGHLHPASRLDASEVHHVLPTEAVLQEGRDLGFGVGVVAADEHRVLPAADTGRADHHRRRHRVQGLDDLGTREGTLDLFGERVGVRHDSDGGIPWEKSRGFETSIMIFPSRLCLPAASSASREPAPLVAFTRSSDRAATSSKVATPMFGCSACQTGNGGFPM